MKKSTNVSATCNPVYVVERPFGSSSWSRACQARGISPHADRSLHSLNNVVHAGECKAAISAMCTKPADDGGKRAGFQRLRPETCQKSHEKAPFLCSNCTEKKLAGAARGLGASCRRAALGCSSPCGLALRRNRTALHSADTARLRADAFRAASRIDLPKILDACFPRVSSKLRLERGASFLRMPRFRDTGHAGRQSQR